MKIRDIIQENTTTAGAIASVAMPMGGVIKRQQTTNPAKYTNIKAPGKKHARR
jgi:hypothetical protein